MSETGAVKFTCEHALGELQPFEGFTELNSCRERLRERSLIGVDPDGVGYGNVSVRNGLTSRFFITCSGTGRIAQLGLAHYAQVTDFSFDRNWLRCEGRGVASSESLTHAAIYETDPSAGAVIHCHDAKLWRRLLESVPFTAAKIEYGTPAMAYEVRRLFEMTKVNERKIFAMAGHEDGIIAFGKNPADAFASLTSAAEL